MFDYELEKGSKKFTCPNCGAAKKFKRYQNERGEYLPPTVGRCDREHSCGYHYKKTQFFIDNPAANTRRGEHSAKGRKRGIPNYGFAGRGVPRHEIKAKTLPKKPDYIDFHLLLRTLANYENNSFVQFLFGLFPEDANLVRQAINNYFIGTTKDGKTIFWQVDQNRKIRTGKIMLYGTDGHRNKNYKNWIHAELMKRQEKLPGDFNLVQCFFGEHLLLMKPDLPVAIVEAEKTAVIASVCFPEFAWLSTGGKHNLKVDKLKNFSSRKIILYPDGEKDAFERWKTIAFEAQNKGLSVKVSSFIEDRATGEQKANGYDLADYMIAEQMQINEHNFCR